MTWSVFLGAFAAIAVLILTAVLAFKAGSFWGEMTGSASRMSSIVQSLRPADDATNWERVLRKRVIQAITSLVAEGVRTEDMADVLRDIADDLDDDVDTDADPGAGDGDG